MVATSAIFFDLEGWVDTYASIPPERVIFMVVSLYVAKLSIVKILSIKKRMRTRFSLEYINHILLRTVLITSLTGMVFVSAVGIYSSLASNTMKDVKNTTQFSNKKVSLERRIKDIDTYIKTQNTIMLDLPDNFANVPIFL
jgi:hypothetical protein